MDTSETRLDLNVFHFVFKIKTPFPLCVGHLNTFRICLDLCITFGIKLSPLTGNKIYRVCEQRKTQIDNMESLKQIAANINDDSSTEEIKMYMTEGKLMQSIISTVEGVYIF